MTIRRNVEFILRKKQMNKADIGLKSIQKIAKALGVKASDLIQSPPLSDQNYFHEEAEQQNPETPSKATFVCPACGSKLVVVTEESIKTNG